MNRPLVCVVIGAEFLLAHNVARAAENAESTPSVQSATDREVPKTAVQLGVGPSGVMSNWQGDGGAGGSLRLGLLLFRSFAPDLMSRLLYSSVDDRVLTYLSLGATGYLPLRTVRPYMRLAFVHQHEESRAAIMDDPGNAALGVGNNIRHRAGFAGGLGVEAPVRKIGRSVFTLGGDVTATHLPDPRGPSTYLGATFWIGVNHAL